MFRTIFVMIFFIISMISCTTAPEKYSEVQNTSNKADEYWELRNVPQLGGKGFKKIAISEFNVEFVTRRFENVFSESQYKVSLLDAVPLARSADIMRIGERNIKLNKEKFQELCNQMYGIYIDKLRSRGLDVITPEAITSNSNYVKFTTKDSASSSLLQRWSPIGSDTGRVKSFYMLPANGLKIITGASKGDVEQIENSLIKNLGADISLRVHFRIGIFREFATVESGSITYITTKNFTGDMSVRRSVISDEKVIGKTHTYPGGSTDITPDYDKYFAAINKIFPRVVSLALERVK